MVSSKEVAQEGQLHDYELIVIINPEISDEALEPVINNVSQFITSRGGVIAKIDRWGKKKLAYPLKHHLEGQYVLASFKLNPRISKEFENHLKLTEEILRHMLIKVG